MILAITLIFVLGYLAIAFEHPLHLDKGATALLLGVICWTLYALGSPNYELVIEQLQHHLGSIAEVIFFLLGAMTIVELIATHNGFALITQNITTQSKRKLLWIICILTFFLSAVLDNLTTAIVMTTLVQKMLQRPSDRLLFAGAIIIAANAGGAWSPMGDITTTMLWVGKQISTMHVIKQLFVPAIICLLVPLLYLSPKVKGTFELRADANAATEVGGKLVLALGMLGLIFVPIFKTITHLPPYLGMMGSVGMLWAITEWLHKGKDDRTHLKIYHALSRIDVPSMLFFLGILLAVGCLESIGQLAAMSTYLDHYIHSQAWVVFLLGSLSAVVDNVPLTAAVQAMYPLTQYPTDHILWESMAYAVGTGGSMLVIGSAAGVVVMGMENISFGWYLRNISIAAALGYIAGFAWLTWI